MSLLRLELSAEVDNVVNYPRKDTQPQQVHPQRRMNAGHQERCTNDNQQLSTRLWHDIGNGHCCHLLVSMDKQRPETPQIAHCSQKSKSSPAHTPSSRASRPPPVHISATGQLPHRASPGRHPRLGRHPGRGTFLSEPSNQRGVNSVRPPFDRYTIRPREINPSIQFCRNFCTVDRTG